jgi:hypothetical protein
VPADAGLVGLETFSHPGHARDRPSDYPEELIEKPETRARMSTLQRDELLTQSEILEKETSLPAKEAHSIPKQSPRTRNMVRIYNRTVVR